MQKDMTKETADRPMDLCGYNGDIHDGELSYKILHSGCYSVFIGRNFRDGSYYVEDTVIEDVGTGNTQIFANVSRTLCFCRLCLTQ